MSVNLNGENLDEIYKVIIQEDKIYINKKFFLDQKIKKDYYQSHINKFSTVDYITLNNLESLRYDLNTNSMQIEILLPIEYFDERIIQAKLLNREIDNGEIIKRGMFINYNITGTRTDNSNIIAASPQLSLFTEYGSFRQDNLITIARDEKKFVRLMTYYQYDNEAALSKLIIGDAYTSSNLALGNALYGGIKYSTDFSLDPYFVTYPTIDLKKMVGVPSNIDIFANNVRLYQGKATAGQYQIADLPVVSGAGNLEVDLTDITGNRERVVIPYYFTPVLLKKGLSSYTYEAGFKRDKFGTADAKYKGFLTNINYHYGVTDKLTSGAYAQTYQGLKVLGIDTAYRLNLLGLVNANVGVSSAKSSKRGQQYSLGYEYRNIIYNVGMRYSYYRSHFSDVSNYPIFYRAGPMVQLFGGISHGKLGSLNLSYTKSKRKDNFSFLSANYQKNIFSNFNLTAQLSKSFGSDKSLTFMTGLQFQFHDAHAITVSHEKNGDSHSSNIEYNKNKKDNLDPYYRVKLLKAKKLYYYTEYQKQFSKVRVRLEKDNISSKTFEQANIQGAIIFNEGVHFSDLIDETFTVVKAGNLSGVEIMANNSYVGKTGSNGVLVTTRAVSKNENQISINEASLPFNAQFSDSRKFYYPKRLTGTKITFDVAKKFAYSAKLFRGDKPLQPPGSILTLDETGAEFKVGFDGKVFINSIEKLNNLNATVCSGRNEQSCCKINYDINIIENDTINNLGAIECL